MRSAKFVWVATAIAFLGVAVAVVILPAFMGNAARALADKASPDAKLIAWALIVGLTFNALFRFGGRS